MKTIQFRTIIFLLCLFILQNSAVFAVSETEPLFHQGNEAYSSGDYVTAIRNFQQIIDNEGYSAAVLYNLANSYAQSGERGQAILAYERALRLSPSDPDIKGNLELIKKESGLFPKEPSRAEKFFALLTLKQWSLLALFSLAALTLFNLIGLKYRFTKQTTVTVVTLSALILSLGSIGTVFEYRNFNPSVVIAKDVRLLVSPFTSANSIGALQEGRLVYSQKHHNNFLYVTDETDRKGWTPMASVEAVVIKDERN